MLHLILISQIHNTYETPSTYKTLFIQGATCQITENLNREKKKKPPPEQKAKWYNKEKL